VQPDQDDAAGFAAGADDDDVDDELEPDDELDPDDEVEDEEVDDAGVAPAVDAAGLSAVDFAPARASLR
jgi:hypothetical protein